MGRFDRFFERFAILYARGVWFYAAQAATNLAVFPTLFRPLADKLARLSKL